MKIKSMNAMVAATCLLTVMPVMSGQAGDGAADRLEEVVVTAQRREEKLQDVPVSVVAFDEVAIRQAGIRNTADFLGMTPNVSFDQSFTVGNSFVTMRGIEQINNADSPVAVVVDGVPQGNQKQLKMELFDVERIEVLEGPQGALYGRNAIGGAINIITKQPTNNFSGFAQIGAGSGQEREGIFALSGPIISDKLLFRVSGEYKDADGQINNSYLHEKVDFYTSKDVRAKLLWLASDTITVDGRYAHTDNTGGATYDVAIPNSIADPTNVQNIDPHADILGNSHLRSDDATIKADWRLSPGTLTWITGFTRLNETYYGSLGFCNPIDCPGGFFGLGSLDQHQDLEVRLLSHELRFTSNSNQPVRYIVGAYYLDTHRDLLTVAHALDLPGAPAIVDSNEHNINTAYAGFGQVDWDFTSSTTLSVSGRYDKDDRNQTDVATGHERSASYDAFQPKVTLSQKFDANQLGYLTYSTGFRSGGFNGIGQLAPFKEELLRNLEAGYKSTWLDQRLVVNVAAFLERDTGFQFFYVDLAAGGAQVIANLNSVQLYGTEIQTQGVIAHGWTAYLNIGLLESRIRDFDANLGVPAALGNKTPKTVPDKFNLGTQKEWTFEEYKAGLRVDFEYRGKKYWDTSNVDVMNPVKLLSARASLKRGSWELAVSGRNLLNQYYFEDFNAKTFSGLPNNIGWPTQPRSVEATLRYDF
jgi:iron complex outermembrane recepter protein